MEPEQITNRQRMRTMVKMTLNINFRQPILTDKSPLSPTKTEISNVQDPRSFQNFYTILKKIGEGCNGVVKKCKENKTGDIYAVKISTMLDEELIEITKKCYRIMKRIHHENVIRPKSLFINQNVEKAMIVMQYCPYASLQKLIETKQIQQDQFKLIIRELLRGILAIHHAGVCHRDIKPDNILYNLQTHKLKIIDFGVSKLIYNRKRTIIKQKMWTMTGSPHYKAPQMFNQQYDQKIDSWAIGITTYEILFRKLPFESEQQIQLIQQIRTVEPDYKGLKIKQSSLAIDFIKSLLKKNPQQRSSVMQALSHPWIQSGDKLNKSQFFLNQDVTLKKLMNTQSSLSMSRHHNETESAPKRLNNFSLESDIFQIQKQIRIFDCVRSSSFTPEQSHKNSINNEKRPQKKFSLQLFQCQKDIEAKKEYHEI